MGGEKAGSDSRAPFTKSIVPDVVKGTSLQYQIFYHKSDYVNRLILIDYSDVGTFDDHFCSRSIKWY